ncbi:planctomycete cytochrome c domain protein : Planctomycete cytochrome C domain protein OS=Rhodopirellula sp. SWK7 GN=RRSWK_00334 PE=4 SV=1 [Gemmata massiliana]|uniref:Planctomycete cytochrome c domain protein: Planctomycete cytochrome C domain protein n=1 Tax=Gemmata massiliana TaxID=1210884 RepID=A0A6P2D8M2_9BACT|nr:DUF4384 domain-containing protein [Gemmata massiliana]VTR95840.1 planctomycete cytochrome c domain protein : Planctomycete cytochrome C domain protein OS=Rhodopirellula sp. SWK7 GN=RRSWK_00334 PE=4 SV=1 [Gemmata massiliana]
MSRAVAALVLFLSPPFVFGATPEHRVNGDLAIRARDILKRYCAECHTGSLDPGASKLKLMDHKQVVSKAPPIPFATPDGRSLILNLVKDGSMPPANRPGPNADEIEILEKWVSAKAPAYPIAFDESTTLTTIADDFASASEAVKAGEPGEYLRYVSFAHLIKDKESLPNLIVAEQQLRDALALATGNPASLEPIDATATTFRIDIRKLGWHTNDLFNKMEGRTVGGVFRFQLFDLILLEYPHARELAANDPLATRLTKLIARGSQIRPVPYIRADWLAGALVDGNLLSRALGRSWELTPLAVDLKALVALERGLAQKAEELVGPVAKPFARARSVAVPETAEGRAPIPLSAWYVGDVTPAKPPFVLKAELVVDNKVVTRVKEGESFQLRVSCDRTVFFTLLMIQADGDVRMQALQGGTVLKADTERTLTPNGKGFVISSILTGGDTGTEYFVLLASETEFPLPTVIQSKHPERPVRRFLLNPTAKEAFDPNAMVRRLVPIEITSK